MKTNDILTAVQKLDLKDKIYIVESIWNDIADQNSTLQISEWQKITLNKRYNEYVNGEIELFNCDEVHEELKNKYK